MYNDADLSKTRNVCMYLWLYELNITNYYIILLNPFVCLCILLACRLGRVSYSGGGGRGAPWDFHPQKAMISLIASTQ